MTHEILLEVILLIVVGSKMVISTSSSDPPIYNGLFGFFNELYMASIFSCSPAM